MLEKINADEAISEFQPFTVEKLKRLGLRKRLRFQVLDYLTVAPNSNQSHSQCQKYCIVSTALDFVTRIGPICKKIGDFYKPVQEAQKTRHIILYVI